MAKLHRTPEMNELSVIIAIGRAKARTVAAVSASTGLDRRRVTAVLNGMKKGPPGDWYKDSDGDLKLGKRGVGRLRGLSLSEAAQ